MGAAQPTPSSTLVRCWVCRATGVGVADCPVAVGDGAAVEAGGIVVAVGVRLAGADRGRVLSGDGDIVGLVLGSIVAVAVDGIQPLNRIKPTRPKTTSIRSTGVALGRRSEGDAALHL